MVKMENKPLLTRLQNLTNSALSGQNSFYYSIYADELLKAASEGYFTYEIIENDITPRKEAQIKTGCDTLQKEGISITIHKSHSKENPRTRSTLVISFSWLQ